MFIHEQREWHRAAKSVTAERAWLNRREFVAAMGLGLIGAAMPGMTRHAHRHTGASATHAMGDEARGPFVEFAADRELARTRAQSMDAPARRIQVGGLLRRARTIDLDDLLRRFPPEERAFRFRCVEGWAMTVPWAGFAMRALVEWCRPTSAAKYVRFVAACDAERMPGIREQPWHRWPYAEGLTIAEAMNELTFLATQAYGRNLRAADGAPLRLVVPWKYAHKSIKGIARIEFLAERPATFWNSALPYEYPFEANVDPRIPHPRWTQQVETLIPTGEQVATQPFNGYAQFVANLYRS